MAGTIPKSQQKLAIFVAEYLISENGKKAAIAAGYAENSAAVTASKLLKKPNIREQIERKQQERLKRLQMTDDEILDSLAAVPRAEATIAKFLKVDQGGLLYYDFTEATDADLRAINPAVQEIETQEYSEGRGEDKRNLIKSKVKFADRRGCLELLGRNKKLWIDRLEVDDLSGLTPEQRKEKALQIVRDSLARGEQ